MLCYAHAYSKHKQLSLICSCVQDFKVYQSSIYDKVSDSDVTFLAMIFTKTNLRNTGFTLKSTKYAVSRRDSDAIYAKHEVRLIAENSFIQELSCYVMIINLNWYHQRKNIPKNTD